jgi:hypothetical protein
MAEHTTTRPGGRPAARGGRPTAARPGTATVKNVPLAAVSFVSGLVGLLVANLLLGPLAVVVGLVALRKDPSRRSRAALGILLGLADLAVFFLLAAHSGHGGSLSWNFLSR